MKLPVVKRTLSVKENNDDSFKNCQRDRLTAPWTNAYPTWRLCHIDLASIKQTNYPRFFFYKNNTFSEVETLSLEIVFKNWPCEAQFCQFSARKLISRHDRRVYSSFENFWSHILSIFLFLLINKPNVFVSVLIL